MSPESLQGERRPVETTNNFFLLFECDQMSELELRRVGWENSPPLREISDLNAQGGLWSRLKAEHSELVTEINALLERKRQEYLPLHYKWRRLIDKSDLEAADRMATRTNVEEIGRKILEDIDPLLIEAEAILVGWGADRAMLRR